MDGELGVQNVGKMGWCTRWGAERGLAHGRRLGRETKQGGQSPGGKKPETYEVSHGLPLTSRPTFCWIFLMSNLSIHLPQGIKVVGL